MTREEWLRLTPKARVVVAAVERGIGVPRIAAAMGVPPNVVYLRLRWAGSRLGRKIKIHPSKPAVSRQEPLRERRCGHCGRYFVWSRSGSGRLRGESSAQGRGFFCSGECAKAARTKLDPVRAIESRKAGQTWLGIAKYQGITTATVQRGVWRYLQRNGLLTEDTVAAIWRPAPGLHQKSYRTAGLRREYGDVPHAAFAPAFSTAKGAP